MAAQKPVKEKKQTSKVSTSSKKITVKKAAASKKGSTLNESSTGKKSQLAKKTIKQEKVTVKAPSKVTATKLTKQSTKPLLLKKIAKEVEKKLKEPVKKTLPAKTPEAKAIATKKNIIEEKKLKAEAPKAKEAKSASVKMTPKNAKAAAEKNNKPIVIPKTSTDKKVDYEPDFLKSVLDAPVVVSQGPTMRYSDSELQEFRDLIGKKLEAAKKELAYLQGLITRRDEMGGDETDNRYMTMEDGGMSMEREQLSQMASRQITFIDHLEKAIMRIENKTYGICRVTGKLIDKARLRAVPHATLSMEAKLGITK